MADESLHWAHPDIGAIPESLDDAWTKNGGGAVTIVGTEYQLVSAAGETSYEKPPFPTDGASTTRATDRMEVQVRMRGVAGFVSPAANSGPWGMIIDDGVRTCALAIGTKLELINPASGVVILELAAAYDYTRSHDLLFVKDGSSRWRVWLDHELVGELAYRFAVASPTGAPYTKWGHIEPGAGSSSTSFWTNIEAGLNRALPKQWRIDRIERSMNPVIQDEWNTNWRAWVRATVGLFEGALQALEDAWEAITAGGLDHPEESFYARGDVLPTSLNPAWTIQEGGHNEPFEVVRERFKLFTDNAGTESFYMQAAFTVAAAVGQETTGRAVFTIQTIPQPGDDERAGAYIRCADGTKQVAAELVSMADLGLDIGWGWVISEGDINNQLDVLGQEGWRIAILRSHTVELRLIRDAWAILLVDGHVVDRVAYSDLSGSGDNSVQVGIAYDDLAPSTCEVEVHLEHVRAARRTTDLNRRDLFLQTAVERLIFVGGCEDNDELDSWVRHHHQVQELRGTTRGIIVELWRMTCSQDAAVAAESQSAEWFLEETYPEVTPIYLELSGSYTDVFFEFPVGATNFTPQQLADLCVRYLLPYSTIELTYFMCLATLTTGAAVVAGGVDKYPVKDSSIFEVGDTVTVHNVANTVIYVTTIDTIPDTTHIWVPSQATTVATGGTIRKTLATS